MKWPTEAMLVRLTDTATLDWIREVVGYPYPTKIFGYDAWGHYVVDAPPWNRQQTVPNREVNADRASIGAAIVDWSRCAFIYPDDGHLCDKPRTGYVEGPGGDWTDVPACFEHGGPHPGGESLPGYSGTTYFPTSATS